jgi:hypothetical protein
LLEKMLFCGVNCSQLIVRDALEESYRAQRLFWGMALTCSALQAALSAQICVGFQNSALKHPLAVRRALGPPAKYAGPDRLDDEFRFPWKIKALLGDVSFVLYHIFFFDKLV